MLGYMGLHRGYMGLRLRSMRGSIGIMGVYGLYGIYQGVYIGTF